jgi:hypothetical protein
VSAFVIVPTCTKNHCLVVSGNERQNHILVMRGVGWRVVGAVF